MKKWLFLTFLIPITGWGQNLVPNPSFESFSNCPIAPNQVDFINNWGKIDTPDFFSSCGSNDYQTPNNLLGIETPKSGLSYVGLYSYDSRISDKREFVYVKLFDTLLNNATYKAEFYISLADTSTIALKSIGITFTSNNPFNFSNDDVLNLDSYLDSNNKYISSKSGWDKLELYFKAKGDELFIIIGNMKFDNSINVMKLPSDNNDFTGSYYYIDDVSLVRVIAKDAAINQIEKRDSCFSLWAQVQNSGIDSLDFTQAPLPYVVEVSQNGNVVQSYVDSIQSNQYNPNNQPLPLDSSMWFPLPALDLSGLQGNYQISVELQWALDEVDTNDRIDSVFTFDLSVGNAQISTDTICFGDEVQLTTANYKGEIQWQSSLDQTQWQSLMSGDTVQHTPIQKTFYRLAVCEAVFSDTFEVEVIKPNLTVLEEKEFCSDHQQTISIKKEDSFTTLRWYTDSNSNSFFYEGIDLDTTLKTSTVFYLAPVLLGCESEERIPLNITISCEIEIPNVFTPNGDGINDLFIYRNVVESKELQTKIFNRWGDLVSQWSGNKGWNGEGQTEGVYFYEIHYNGEKITGVVSLIRD